MLKVFSISFSVLILIQSFGISINDIVQIDEFIAHAQFHSEQYGDNVLVFISKHYGSLKADHEKEHQEEQEEHEKLPFNQNNCIHGIAIVAFIEHAQNNNSFLPELFEFKANNFYYQEPVSSLHSHGLFEPPRHS